MKIGAHDDTVLGLSGRGLAAAAAGVGFLVGFALNPARKALLQGGEALSGDWYDILKTEHRLVEAAFGVLLKTEDHQVGRRQVLLLQIAHALNKHDIQEQNVVYPALRSVDEEAARHLWADHAEIKTLLRQLQYVLKKDDPQWLATVQKLADLVVEHAREEEDEIFPKLRAGGDALNASLTRQLNWEGLKVA